MDEATLAQLLASVQEGETSLEDAVIELRNLPYADLGFARVDHHRALRQTVPEAIYGPGKAPEHCAAIVSELRSKGGPVLLTRASDEQVTAVLRAHPDGERQGRTVTWQARPASWGPVVVVTAGTADLPVADECLATLTAVGGRHERITDVGVAGLHRLLPELERLQNAQCVIVIAGMEGALASVIGGLVSAPVIAVPTSVGYGASLEGVTALLAMLSSCAAGVTVVGIDNGFGAACAAARILGDA